MARFLSHWLTLSLSLLVFVPVLIIYGFLLLFLAPQFKIYVENENGAMNQAVSAQIDSLLMSTVGAVKRLGDQIAVFPDSDSSIALRLDTLASTDPKLEALYLLDANNHVISAGLDRRRQSFREVSSAMDFSERRYVMDARHSDQVSWSEAFRSERGEMVVEVAIPVKNRMVVAELNLLQLSAAVRGLGHPGGLEAILVDREGHIVAHSDVDKSLTHEVLSENSLIQEALKGKITNGTMVIGGVEYTGTARPVPGLGWASLVIQPKASVYAAQRTLLWGLLLGFLLSLVLALIFAWSLARIASRRMRAFSDHMLAVAGGDYGAKFPDSRVTEINELAHNMRRMAVAVLERESRLQHREAEYRDVVEGIDDLILRMDTDRRLLFVNHASRRYFGMEPDACVGLDAFDFVHPDDREKARKGFTLWCQEDGTSIHWENRVLSHSGVVHLMQWNVSAMRDSCGYVLGYTSIARDVTAQRHAETHQRLAASVFNSSSEGIMITDADMRIISVNPALQTITGYAVGEVIGKSPELFDSGRHDSDFYRAIGEEVGIDGHWRGEIWSRRKSGEVFPGWLAVTAVKDADGALTHYIGSCFDISERKDAERHLQFMANHDALTLLPNRVLLDDRIRQAIVTSRRKESRTAILLFDLDRFKLINDTLGHDAGDHVLEAVASRLTGQLRETETVARLGGDEFIILVPDIESIDHLSVLAQKILLIVAEPYVVGEKELHITPSIGISIFPDDCADGPTLLRNAETAMYHAKGVGRNNFQFFTNSMNYVVQERLAIEHDLRHALEKQELLLYYQPQVDCRTGAVKGMEALIRWQHPERGLISPDKFIPIAEETGLIVSIGEWVLHEACRQAKAWHDMGQDELRISVNLSARQFQQDDLLRQISSALQTSGLPSSSLELEITEGMLMEDPETAAVLLRTLAGLGIRLAIDDFGTGYSSLAYLRRFPLHRLKIDKSFVRDISTDVNGALIVSAVIGLASSLKMEVIAEGVESVDQLRYLEKKGCHEIQGYFFSRPLPASHFTSFCYEVPGPASSSGAVVRPIAIAKISKI
ncbi:MAG: EAL domain-containing protein [Sulfuritalea sp.]|nr:EAL domain-containing protein [Sulfuritalea sp.]